MSYNCYLFRDPGLKICGDIFETQLDQVLGESDDEDGSLVRVGGRPDGREVYLARHLAGVDVDVDCGRRLKDLRERQVRLSAAQSLICSSNEDLNGDKDDKENLLLRRDKQIMLGA